MSISLLKLETELDKRADHAWRMEEMVKEVGFVNVVAKRVISPIGLWPKDKKQKERGIC